MQCPRVDCDSLWTVLSNEYQKAAESKKKTKSESIDIKLRTIRIFISSTFRDFHNERNLLVTKVFPRLRDWCGKHGLYLVECDLRWGIPAYVSREETLMTCLDEIERGRFECNDMNFFLGLIGDRYGWIPEVDEITDYIRRRYNWVDHSSVTLMEFIHGMIRTLTPNGLVMIRSPGFINLLPLDKRSDFVENDQKTIQDLKTFKEFLVNKFHDRGLVQFYSPDFDGLAYDRFIDKKRVSLKGLDNFCETVEEFFKRSISENLLKFINVFKDRKGNDDFHALMVRVCGKQCTIRHSTFLRLFNYLKGIHEGSSNSHNPIVVLSGHAGVGKTTILAYCVKELEKTIGYEVFFHSVACTTSSKYNEEIVGRIYRFLSGDQLEIKNTDEKFRVLKDMFTNGVSDSGKKIFFIVLDGLDELSQAKSRVWIPDFTHHSVVVVIGTLLDNDEKSFYRKLHTARRKIWEIEVEPMEKDQLCNVVNNYLNNFGKKLDSSQIDALLSFSSSTNPLWLISACEELRIHGDYATVTKLILSLPSNILDLNKTIMKRLISQDSTNLLRCFLHLLILSRAGLWESIVKEQLASMMGFEEPVSHSTFLDIIRQLKGFLLIESIPLPLIKFRHRVTRQSIESELQLGNDLHISFHRKMADFFGSILESSDNLFLGDYVFHLIKSKSRDRLVNFMRSSKSWSLYNQSFVRSKIFMSMRCNNVVHNSQHNSPSELMMCVLCTQNKGHLSLDFCNENCCYYCGEEVSSSGNENRIPTCDQHFERNPDMKTCMVCETLTPISRCYFLKKCHSCTTAGRCGAIVKETDALFRQQMTASSDNDLESLI